MKTGHRTTAALAEGFTRWLASRRAAPDTAVSDVTLSELSRPSGGYSSETLVVDAAWASTGRRESFVIRMAPAGAGTFPHYDLVSQWQAQSAAAAAGVPVADPVRGARPGWLGAPFMVMPPGRRPHRRRPGPPRPVAARPGAGRPAPGVRNFVAMLAAIHRADVGDGDRRAPPGQPGRARLLGRLPGLVEWRLTRCRPWSTPWRGVGPPAGRRAAAGPAVGRRPLREHGHRRRPRAAGRARLGHDLGRRPRARPGLVHQPRPDHAPSLR